MDKIIHQIWIGPEAMPQHIQQYCARTKSLFNDYEYKFWHNENIPQMPELCMVQFNRYGAMKKYAFQADILRYYLLNKYGGIYLDVDFVCNKRFDSIINKEFFCVNPNGRVFHVCNGIFACNPNNPILTKLLSELRNEPYHGPLLFTKYISEFIGVPYQTHLFKHLNEQPHDYVQCGSAIDFFHRTQGYCYHDALHSWSNKRMN
jgi:mannosyltransferase OCH1-like enzyme